MIGEIVKVIVDRPLGSYHPEYKGIYLAMWKVLLHLMEKNKMHIY